MRINIVSRCVSNLNVTSKKAAYSVFVGREPGVYETWKEAEAQVKGYSGNRYKGFPSLLEARRAYRCFLKEAKVVTESENKPQKVKKTKPGVIAGVDVPPWNLD